MGRLPEPDEVDIIVDGRASSEESLQETIDYINAYKQRPGYAEELQQAMENLEALRLKSPNYQAIDPAELLAQWHRNVEEMKQRNCQEAIAGGGSAEAH